MSASSLLVRAKKLMDHAKRSTHPRAKLAAMIFSNQRVISIGVNSPTRWTSQIPAKYRKWPSAICAEMDALLKAKMDVRGMDILVVRVNKKGDMLMAKPCPHCQAYLEHMGVHNVYYSSTDGLITCLEKENG